MSKYAKAIVAFCTTAAGAVTTVFADGHVKVDEVMIAAFMVLAATFGVYAIPNSDPQHESNTALGD